MMVVINSSRRFPGALEINNSHSRIRLNLDMFASDKVPPTTFNFYQNRSPSRSTVENGSCRGQHHSGLECNQPCVICELHGVLDALVAPASLFVSLEVQ